MCEAYAVQLNSEEHYHKAASYLLCLNKIKEAIDIFVNANMYKEAYVLAASKLDSQDPMTENVLSKWANSAHKDGHFQNASEWYIFSYQSVNLFFTINKFIFVFFTLRQLYKIERLCQSSQSFGT